MDDSIKTKVSYEISQIDELIDKSKPLLSLRKNNDKKIQLFPPEFKVDSLLCSLFENEESYGIKSFNYDEVKILLKKKYNVDLEEIYSYAVFSEINDNPNSKYYLIEHTPGKIVVYKSPITKEEENEFFKTLFTTVNNNGNVCTYDNIKNAFNNKYNVCIKTNDLKKLIPKIIDNLKNSFCFVQAQEELFVYQKSIRIKDEDIYSFATNFLRTMKKIFITMMK